MIGWLYQQHWWWDTHERVVRFLIGHPSLAKRIPRYAMARLCIYGLLVADRRACAVAEHKAWMAESERRLRRRQIEFSYVSLYDPRDPIGSLELAYDEMQVLVD